VESESNRTFEYNGLDARCGHQQNFKTQGSAHRVLVRMVSPVGYCMLETRCCFGRILIWVMAYYISRHITCTCNQGTSSLCSCSLGWSFQPLPWCLSASLMFLITVFCLQWLFSFIMFAKL